MCREANVVLAIGQSNAAEMFEGYPGLNMAAVKASRTVREFDDTLTSVLFNYKNADHFYKDASSDKKLRAVKVPLLCINAEDDPISVSSAIPSRALVDSVRDKVGRPLGVLRGRASRGRRKTFQPESADDVVRQANCRVRRGGASQ
jgi:hypothetical protein